MVFQADMPKHLLREEESYTVFIVRPTPAVSKPDLLSTGYWSNVVNKLTAGDIVKVFPEDTSYYMEMWLVRKSPTSLTWRVLREVDYSSPVKMATIVEDKLEVNWGGPKHRWRVVDTGTPGKNVIASGFSDEAEARTEMERIRVERQGG